MKQFELLMCVLVVMLVSVTVLAQETEPVVAEPVVVAVEPAPVTEATIKAKIDAIEKERNGLKAKLYEARKEIEKSPEVADLRKAASEADKTYQAKKVNDPALIAAKKTSRAAYAAYKALVLENVKASDAGAAIIKEISDLEEKRASLSLQAAIAELKLEHKDSPIARAMAADPVVQEFRTAYYEAKRGPARDKARKDYAEIKKATLAKMPEAQALIDEIQAAKKGMDEAENAAEAAEEKLDKLCDTVEDGDDQDIVAAKAKYSAASEAYEKAYRGGAIQAAREVRDNAKKALYEKAKVLMAQDNTIVALSNKIADLKKQIGELEDQARKLRKKSDE